jgi:hypothetical protein
MKTTPIPTGPYSRRESESILGICVLRWNWVDGTIIRANYLNSTISSPLKPELTINQSLASEVHGNRPLLHCSHCSLISRHRRRFTENYTIKTLSPSFPKIPLMHPFFHRHCRVVGHTLQSLWSWLYRLYYRAALSHVEPLQLLTIGPFSQLTHLRSEDV